MTEREGKKELHPANDIPVIDPEPEPEPDGEFESDGVEEVDRPDGGV